MTLDFTVPGDPVGKARPKVTMNGTFMPKKYVAYLKVVAQVTSWSVKGRPPVDRPVRLVVDSYKARPKSRPSTCPPDLWHDGPVECPVTPDADNIIGSIMDGMEKGGAYTNDSRVCDEHCRTWWCGKGESPRVVVHMEVL